MRNRGTTRTKNYIKRKTFRWEGFYKILERIYWAGTTAGVAIIYTPNVTSLEARAGS